MALPDGKQEIEPAFVHHPAESLPSKEVEGARLRLILGEAFGMISPVEVHTPTLYLEARLATGAELALPEASELAAYVVAGAATVGDCALAAGSMGIVDGPCGAVLRASSDSHVMVIGGGIEQGKRDWAGGAFDAVPGETEFIPLPPG
jgi:redox-sensitive bicupin YhaK (pirin superfamily)